MLAEFFSGCHRSNLPVFECGMWSPVSVLCVEILLITFIFIYVLDDDELGECELVFDAKREESHTFFRAKSFVLRNRTTNNETR
jgi:hypothetical protein